MKEEQREQSIDLGRTLLEKESAKHDFSLPATLKAGDVQALAKDFSFDAVDDLYAAIGYGLYTPLQILGKIIPETPKVGRIQKMIDLDNERQGRCHQDQGHRRAVRQIREVL